MRSFFEGTLLSICFFTQFPIFHKVKEMHKETYGYLAIMIPLSGLLLSAFILATFTLLVPFAHEIYVAIIVSVVYLFMYGFLHLEAVADIIDSFYAKHGGKDAYSVVKDAHVGALGAIGTFSLVILKVSALSYLLIEGDFLGIIAVLYLSRMMATGAIYSFDFHPDSTFILSMKEAINRKSMFIFLLISIMILLILKNLLLLPFAIMITVMLHWWLKKYIGFLNGDGLGFIIELNELLLLNILIFS